MFLGMQNFDFDQIQSNCPNLITFAQISPQNFAKFLQNVIKFAQIIFIESSHSR